uniref:Uncharacterized protein n=1 Tax=Megaselia scalaris TaxID=36166 RepID=T1GSB6_MEGSC
MLFSVIFIAILSFSNAERLGNCKVGHKFENLSMPEFKLSDFENNDPRETEFLRTMVYFKYSEPAFSIWNLPNQITFGYLGSLKKFAIFKSHKDYLEHQNPCSSLENITYFSDTKYVGTVFILESEYIY